LGSELLEKLSALDARAAETVAEARKQADEVAASLGSEVEALEDEAEKKLSAELDARAAELAAEREKLLAEIEADRRRQMEGLKAVPEEKTSEAAAAVVRSLTET